MCNRGAYSRLILMVAMLACAPSSLSQSLRTEHTYKLDDPGLRPAATIEDVAWLAGNWQGEAFGDVFEEVWNPPSAGTMIGMFKLLNEGEVAFYELLLLVEEEGSLSMKVKHFNPDFTSWEEKEDYITFRLVRLEPNAIHFSGLSFYRKGPDEIRAYLAMRENGELREEALIFRRR